MGQSLIPRATLGRLPVYLNYLKSLSTENSSTISAAHIARELGLGEVQVRKDLGTVSGEGKPKIGYIICELIFSIENYLGRYTQGRAVIVGAGKLGRALLDYDGFGDYGLEIAAAFDSDVSKLGCSEKSKPIYSANSMEEYCRRENIRIGIITVPAAAAQDVCDRLIAGGVTAVWSFAPVKLNVPDNVALQQENLALSLAHLNNQISLNLNK